MKDMMLVEFPTDEGRWYTKDKGQKQRRHDHQVGCKILGYYIKRLWMSEENKRMITDWIEEKRDKQGRDY